MSPKFIGPGTDLNVYRTPNKLYKINAPLIMVRYNGKSNSSPDSDLDIRGPFFEGIFKAKLIDNEEYLSKCLVYMSLNALKHGMVDNIEEYKWTSYHSLIDKNKIKEYKDYIIN